MALKDGMSFGMVLPHRDPDPISMETVRETVLKAEALGFSDLWVTENTLDEAFSFDPAVILTYAAALTSRIRLGVSVVVLPVHNPIHVAHAFASLDYVSGGRAILGVGLGRESEYADFQVPTERRVRRFTEGIRAVKELWTQDRASYDGQVFKLQGGEMRLKPVQKPHPPLWMGGGHPDAVRRAAQLADGWMAAGGSTTAGFGASVPILKDALEKAGKDPNAYPISKRVFLSVHEKPEVARAEVNRWYTQVYHNPAHTDASGVHGTPSQVREQLEALKDMGANHLLLNAVARYPEQVDALAEVTGQR